MGLKVQIPIEGIQNIGAGIKTSILNQTHSPGYFKMKVNIATRDFIRYE